MHYISDLNGHPIKVTDITKAIQQAEEFMHYRSTDETFRPPYEHRAKYWTDMQYKLLQLQNQLHP